MALNDITYAVFILKHNLNYFTLKFELFIKWYKKIGDYFDPYLKFIFPYSNLIEKVWEWFSGDIGK